MPSGNSAPRTTALIILSGLPGSGKTTFARALASRRDITVIESDAIRRSIAATPAYTRAESARVFDTVEANATRALDRGQAVLIDATNVANADRARFLQLARRYGIRPLAIRLVAPTGTIRERLERPRDGYSQADFDVYRRMKPRVEPLPLPTIVVDSRYDFAPSLDLVELLLDAG